MLDRICTSVKAFWQQRISSLPTLVRAALGVTAVVLLLFLVTRFSTYFVARSYVDEVVTTLGINKHLGNAIFWGSFVALTYFSALVVSLSKARRVVGALKRSSPKSKT